MNEKRFLGCGDNSCIFERPSVGTNGGCRCFNDIDDRAIRHRVRQAAQRQRQEILALTRERDEAVKRLEVLYARSETPGFIDQLLAERDEAVRERDELRAKAETMVDLFWAHCASSVTTRFWQRLQDAVKALDDSLTTDKAAQEAGEG